MVIIRNGIKVIRPIRKLLKDYGMILFNLNSKNFKRILKISKLGKNTIGFIDLNSFDIYINADYLKGECMAQSMVNYLYLHEIGHGITGSITEEDAHKKALELAKRYNIEIDYDDIDLPDEAYYD